jgi:hypothetical protein
MYAKHFLDEYRKQVSDEQKLKKEPSKKQNVLIKLIETENIEKSQSDFSS